MITFIYEDSDDLVAFTLADEVTAEDVDQIANTLEKAFDIASRVNLYIEIAETFEASLGGLLEQAKKGFTVILPNLGKIRKAALVTDKSWLKRIGDFGGMFPSMEIRGFSSAETDAAIQWVRL